VRAAIIRSHRECLASADAVKRHLWVALKHEITYCKPAYFDDEAVAAVILEKVYGARAFYETVTKRGEVVLAEAKPIWCCLDATTLRPARLLDDIIERFFDKADE
jgi:acyl-CoA thioester hydrolase